MECDKVPLKLHLMKPRVGVEGNTQSCALLFLGGLQDSIQPHHTFTGIICTIVDAYLDYRASLGLTDMLLGRNAYIPLEGEFVQYHIVKRHVLVWYSYRL